ncbi:MAG TPA: outer membrane beta-barrel protein [Gammaproteobacteria bacterium]|nr:outer membrane beta-barrel protein [Gammaproteobacteria bacterium]
MNAIASRTMAGPALLLLGAIAIVPVQARAQDWILGGAVGSAKQQDYAVAGSIATREDTDTAFRLFGGYLVSPMQGVVVSYVDLDTPHYEGPAFGGFADSLDGYGVDLSYLAGWAPGEQQRVSLFGTVGIFHWNQDVTLTDASGRLEYGDDGTSFSAGFGADINLSADGTNAWGIHVAYQLFKNVGEAENSGHEYDRELLSVGIDYRFGRRE